MDVLDVIDADDLAHNALDREGEGYKKFLDIFGETFLDENSEKGDIEEFFN